MIHAAMGQAPIYHSPPQYDSHQGYMVIATSPPYDPAEGEFNVEDWQIDVWARTNERGVNV